MTILTGGQSREEWEQCRLRQFDAKYDFATYQFLGVCERQVTQNAGLNALGGPELISC